MLTALGERDYARRLARRPGQKEDRFEHLLGPRAGGEGPVVASAPTLTEPRASAPVDHPGSAPAPQNAQPPAAAPPAVDVDGVLAERVATLEAEVATLRSELDELRDLLTTPAAH